MSAKETAIVVVPAEQLAALVSQAVRDALGSSSCGEMLVDKQTLAQKLGCSAAHIDHLRKRGLPTMMVGQVVRFEPVKVLDWLREHSAA